MKRKLIIIILSLIVLQFITGNEDTLNIEDDLSRLILLDFNYFTTPYPLPDLSLTNASGQLFSLGQTRGNGVILVFLGENDPFNDELRYEMNELRKRYLDMPLLFIAVSHYVDDFKDLNGFTRGSLGVLTYPSYFIIDHNYNLRGSAEGIYPSLLSEDFIKILDKLLLDIKSPGIINTLK